MPLSPVQRAKRAFVSVLLTLATAYGLHVDVTRESGDETVQAAYRKVSRSVHPDKGGCDEDAQRLNTARDAWQDARRAGQPAGRPLRRPAAATPLHASALTESRRTCRVNATAVLLTYQSWPSGSGTATWEAFCRFVSEHVEAWAVKHWASTMEANAAGSHHLHLMLQFNTTVDVPGSRFIFDGRRPNVSSHDYLGEGFCKKKLQQSIDRGMFYVWANKCGTAQLPDGRLCVAGNYAPCWTAAPRTYQVLGKWPETLWKQRKLETAQYEEYLFLTRDGVLARKRNLDAVKEHEAAVAEAKVMESNKRRLRSNPEVYRSFPVVPLAQDWLATFQEDRLRYPVLVVLGASHTGKTEWAKSLFKQPLELKVGSLLVFPASMRAFDRTVHDGIILDDVRDLDFLAEHQDKLQGKYDVQVEFATTPGGTCAYKKYLFAVPIAVTVNHSTRNLDYLETHDWLKQPSNRVLARFPDVLGPGF